MSTAESAAHPRITATAGLLQLMWLASPALPVGGFSYSEGLESAVDAGLVHDEASASDWLVDQLLLSLARSDLAVVAQAIPAWRSHDLARITALNDWVLQTRETAELRQQTEQMGRSLLTWAEPRSVHSATVWPKRWRRLSWTRPPTRWPWPAPRRTAARCPKTA